MPEDVFEYVCHLCGWQYQTINGLYVHIPTHTLTPALYGTLADAADAAAATERAERAEAQVEGLREAAGILDAAYELMQQSYGPDRSIPSMLREVERARAALAPAPSTTGEEATPRDGDEAADL